MMQPDPEATAIAEPVTVALGDLEQASVSFTPERSGTELLFWSVAASKFENTTYRILIDSSSKYGPARFPPTDLDNTAVIWTPPERVEESLTVEVSNLNEDGRTREYHILPLGWES